MGSDFNKAAGLPNDFKIHKSTLDDLICMIKGLSSETLGLSLEEIKRKVKMEKK